VVLHLHRQQMARLLLPPPLLLRLPLLLFLQQPLLLLPAAACCWACAAPLLPVTCIAGMKPAACSAASGTGIGCPGRLIVTPANRQANVHNNEWCSYQAGSSMRTHLTQTTAVEHCPLPSHLHNRWQQLNHSGKDCHLCCQTLLCGTLTSNSNSMGLADKGSQVGHMGRRPHKLAAEPSCLAALPSCCN
jgi:hypothetical protein